MLGRPLRVKAIWVAWPSKVVGAGQPVFGLVPPGPRSGRHDNIFDDVQAAVAKPWKPEEEVLDLRSLEVIRVIYQDVNALLGQPHAAPTELSDGIKTGLQCLHLCSKEMNMARSRPKPERLAMVARNSLIARILDQLQGVVCCIVDTVHLCIGEEAREGGASHTLVESKFNDDSCAILQWLEQRAIGAIIVVHTQLVGAKLSKEVLQFARAISAVGSRFNDDAGY